MVSGGGSIREEGGVGHHTRRRSAVTSDDGGGWLGLSSRPASPFHLNRLLLFRFSRLLVRYAYNRTGFSLLARARRT
ncbi:hypothetical protein Hanom_Chr14g01304121 [Helianthus anomalus]